MIFNWLAQRANDQRYLDNFETILKLSMRAQSQCRATLEALANIKNPQNVAFVKQANIAHNQQINNNQTGPQLEHTHGNYLDTGTTTAASGNDPAMAAMGEIHRPEDRQGQD